MGKARDRMNRLSERKLVLVTRKTWLEELVTRCLDRRSGTFFTSSMEAVILGLPV